MSEDRSAPEAPSDAAADEPVVSAAPAAEAEPRPERDPDDEPPIEDPALLGAALRQELAGDGGAGARRVVIAIGVVIIACVAAMIVYVFRSAPTLDDATSPSSARPQQTSARHPARIPIRKIPPRKRRTPSPSGSVP